MIFIELKTLCEHLFADSERLFADCEFGEKCLSPKSANTLTVLTSHIQKQDCGNIKSTVKQP